MHAPLFWKDRTKLSTLLLPASFLYGYVARWRETHTLPQTLSVPVVCIGNVLVGGSGKTPVALALGEMLKARGDVHYLLRGYKGKLKGPVCVDPAIHTATDVGDEALLLAKVLPTWVSADRVAGAKAAIAGGAGFILMDDGFQNPTLYKDLSLVVIDGAYGFGNGRLLPSGPLRELPERAMKRANAVILIGEDRHETLKIVPSHLPVFRATIEPALPPDALKDVSVVAFAGIARPRKFYRTLKALGADVRRMQAYPDHHAFTPRDLAFLQEKAQELEARLVTTEKDHVRLPESMRRHVLSVPVKAVFEDDAALLALMPKEASRLTCASPTL